MCIAYLLQATKKTYEIAIENKNETGMKAAEPPIKLPYEIDLVPKGETRFA